MLARAPIASKFAVVVVTELHALSMASADRITA